jgi:hypothetical protein
MKAAAIVLIVLGVGIVIWGGFGFKTEERVFDAGPIHATREKEHHVPYGPLVDRPGDTYSMIGASI